MVYTPCNKYVPRYIHKVYSNIRNYLLGLLLCQSVFKQTLLEKFSVKQIFKTDTRKSREYKNRFQSSLNTLNIKLPQKMDLFPFNKISYKIILVLKIIYNNIMEIDF